MQKLLAPGATDAGNPATPALAALERAEEALAEAETLLTRLAADAEADPNRLERAEERLFALRAAARKYDVRVAELPTLLDTLSGRLADLETGAAGIADLRTGGGTRARSLRRRRPVPVRGTSGGSFAHGEGRDPRAAAAPA